MKNPKTLVILFFCFLFVGLFLGDGRQSVIDVYIASITLVLWGARFVYRRSNRSLPQSLVVPWIAFMLVVFISALFSDSIGFSISWLSRLLSGYLCYRLFYEISSDDLAVWFVNGGIFLALGAGALSVVFSIFPGLRTMLPAMNLVGLTYGHNHLADLLVFVAPFVMHWSSGFRTQFRYASMVVYSILLLSTFSLGAWVLVTFYFGYRAVKQEAGTQQKLNAVISLIFFLACLFPILTRPVIMKGSTVGLLSFAAKSSSVQNRFEYWRQAIVSVRERPFLGAGPGTFSLTSTRLQIKPQTSSWFVHSEALQLASEIGIIGLFTVFWLLWSHIVLLRRQRINQSKVARALQAGILLVLLYSIFEFVLDYAVVWLFLWASVGVVLGTSRASSTRHASGVGTWLPLSFLVVFYLFWTASALFSTVLQRDDLAFFVSPFDSDRALIYLLTAPRGSVNKNALRLILVFHKENPQTLFAAAKLLQTEGDTTDATHMYSRAADDDPFNVSYQKQYLLFLKNTGQYEKLADQVKKICTSMAPKHTSCQSHESLADERRLAESFQSHLDVLDETFSFAEGLQKLLYLAGLDMRTENSGLTRTLWTAAFRLQPNWGYYPVELAALEYYTFDDSQAARSVLSQCSKIIYTATWCSGLYNNLNSLPPVGAQEKNILAIPQILPY